MTTQVTNQQRQIELFAKDQVEALYNVGYACKYTNKKHDKFNEQDGSLGNSVLIRKPYRSVVSDGVAAVQQGFSIRLQTLAVTQAKNTAHAWSPFDFQFYKDSFMDDLGLADVASMGTAVELDLMKSISGTMVGSSNYNTDLTGNNPFAGITQFMSGPYRFSDFTQNGASYQSIAQAMQELKTFGAVQATYDVLMHNMDVSPIIGTGQGQFLPQRNEENFNSWEIGSFNGMNFFQSNCIEPFYAGVAGAQGITLTLVSASLTPVVGSPGDYTTTLVLSGAPSNTAQVVKVGDLMYFLDSAGLNLRQFTGYGLTPLKVQMRALADADSDNSGNVTVLVTPGLDARKGPTQNLNKALQAGMQLKVVGDHRRGAIISRKYWYSAFPALPPRDPFVSGIQSDKDFGLSYAKYYGSELLSGTTVMTDVVTYGSMMLQEYHQALCFPL